MHGAPYVNAVREAHPNVDAHPEHASVSEVDERCRRVTALLAEAQEMMIALAEKGLSPEERARNVEHLIAINAAAKGIRSSIMDVCIVR